MKRVRAPALSPEALDEFARGEATRVRQLRLIVASPDRSSEDRVAAFNEACGICMRAGSMLLGSPEQKAAGTAAAREQAAKTTGTEAKRIQAALIEAEGLVKFDGRGRRKAVDSYAAQLAGVSPKTISRYRKRMGTG